MFLALGHAACDRRSDDCLLFIGAVNQALHQIEELPLDARDADSAATQRRDMARRYERLARTIESLDLQSRVVGAKSETYRELTVRAARHLNELAAALSAKNTAEAERQQAAYERVVKQQRDLVRDINAACGW